MVPSLPLLLVWPLMVRPETVKFARPRIPSDGLRRRVGRLARRGSPSPESTRSGRAEHRRRNPEDHVVVGDLRREVRLRERAAARAEPAGDREERVHAAVGRAVGVARRSALRAPDRSPRGTTAGDRSRRSGVANATCGFTAGLEPPTAGCEWQPPQLSRFMRRAQALGDVLLFREVGLTGVEVFELVRSDSPPMARPRCGGAGPSAPGSTALMVDDAMWICAATKNAAAADTSSDVEDMLVFMPFPP